MFGFSCLACVEWTTILPTCLVKSKPVKQEVSRSVMLPPKVSVLCYKICTSTNHTSRDPTVGNIWLTLIATSGHTAMTLVAQSTISRSFSSNIQQIVPLKFPFSAIILNFNCIFPTAVSNWTFKYEKKRIVLSSPCAWCLSSLYRRL